MPLGGLQRHFFCSLRFFCFPLLYEVQLNMTDSEPDNVVVAYPEQENVDIRAPLVQTFCDYCRSVKPAGDYADRADFDPFTLRPWLGYIMILEHLPAEDDFRYRMFGTYIAAQTGFDMTGQRVSDFSVAYGNAFGAFVKRMYSESVARKTIIYAEHTRIYSRVDCDWHRVLCPVRASDTIQIIVCNYPVARQRPLGDDI
jgi:PAS domain